MNGNDSRSRVTNHEAYLPPHFDQLAEDHSTHVAAYNHTLKLLAKGKTPRKTQIRRKV